MDSGPHADTYAGSYGYTHPCSYYNPNTDTDANGYAGSNGYGNRDAGSHANAHTGSYSNTL